MPPQTFAQGGAICLAMDRPRHHRGIILQRADNRMLFQKGERLLFRCLAPHELADGSQPVAAAGQRDIAGFFQGFAGVRFGER